MYTMDNKPITSLTDDAKRFSHAHHRHKSALLHVIRQQTEQSEAQRTGHVRQSRQDAGAANIIAQHLIHEFRHTRLEEIPAPVAAVLQQKQGPERRRSYHFADRWPFLRQVRQQIDYREQTPLCHVYLSLSHIGHCRLRLALLNETLLGSCDTRMLGRPIVRIVPPKRQEGDDQNGVRIERPLPAALFDESAGERPGQDRAHIAAGRRHHEQAQLGWRRPRRDQTMHIRIGAALRHTDDEAQHEETDNGVVGGGGGQRTQHNRDGGHDEGAENELATDAIAIEQKAHRCGGQGVGVEEGAE